MRTNKIVRPISFIIFFGLLITTGCNSTRTPWCYYFQREPIRIVILPSENKTEHPDAPVIFNQACEEALKKKGFDVVSADKVVAYTSSRGLLLSDVTKLKASQLGKDFNADMVLYSDITKWESSYAVLNTKVCVAGTSRMIESSTDSLVWHYSWLFMKDSSSGNNNVIGMLVSAAVDVVANSMFDAVSRLGTQAGTATVNSLPKPGFAPSTLKPKPKEKNISQS